MICNGLDRFIQRRPRGLSGFDRPTSFMLSLDALPIKATISARDRGLSAFPVPLHVLHSA